MIDENRHSDKEPLGHTSALKECQQRQNEKGSKKCLPRRQTKIDQNLKGLSLVGVVWKNAVGQKPKLYIFVSNWLKVEQIFKIKK